MGYDQHEKSSSSGAIVAVLVALLIVAVLGGLLLVGVGTFFWVRTAQVSSQRAMRAEQEARVQAEHAQAIAEMNRIEAEQERQRFEAMSRTRPALETTLGSPDPQNELQNEVRLKIARDGSLSVDGEQVELDAWKARLKQVKEEAGAPVSVHIEIDADSLHEHLIPVLDACQDMAAEVRLRIVPSGDTGSTTSGLFFAPEGRSAAV
jgi:hypothetical protein